MPLCTHQIKKSPRKVKKKEKEEFELAKKLCSHALTVILPMTCCEKHYAKFKTHAKQVFILRLSKFRKYLCSSFFAVGKKIKIAKKNMKMIFPLYVDRPLLHKPTWLHSSLHSIWHKCNTIECREEWNFRELFLIGGVMTADDTRETMCVSVHAHTWATVIFLSQTTNEKQKTQSQQLLDAIFIYFRIRETHTRFLQK